MRSIFLLIMTLTALTGYTQEYYLLTGTYTRQGSKGIYVFRFNAQTGTATSVSEAAASNPSYLATRSDGKVYAVNEDGGKGAVSAYDFDPSSGTLTLLNSQPSHGDHPCHVALDKTGNWAVIANYTGGNFAIYPILSDGQLGEAAQVIQHTGSSVNKERQEKAHAHAAAFSPDNRYLTIVDLGMDKLMVYPFNPKKKKPLGDAHQVPVPPGTGPRHLIFHPRLPYAYTIEELSGFVTAYSVKGGQFNPFQTLSAHPENFTGSIGSAAIRISPDGKFLYASNRGSSNTIAAFAVDSGNGRLTLKQIAPTKGEGPRDFVIDPSGRFLLCANTQSGNVRIFTRDAITGLLDDTGEEIRVSSPASLCFLPE